MLDSRFGAARPRRPGRRRRVGLAGRRSRPPPIRGRERSLWGRPASRHRCRRAGGHRCACTRVGSRCLCRFRADCRAHAHDPHRRRLLDHARPPRRDRRSGWHARRGGRGGGHRWAERRARGCRALCPHRDSAHGRAARLRRSAHAASGSRSKRRGCVRTGARHGDASPLCPGRATYLGARPSSGPPGAGAGAAAEEHGTRTASAEHPS